MIDEFDHFTYLGSVVDRQGGTEADVKAGIGKARIFNTLVKAVFLYGAEISGGPQ